MFECFSGLQVQLPNAQFRWTSHSAVFELKVMSQCCWNWSQCAWVGLQSSCLHAVTRHSLQLKLKKFPRFLYLWSQVIRSAFNISNCSGLITTLRAEIPLFVIFFQIIFKTYLPKLLITMSNTFFLTPFLPTTIFLLSTFPLNNAACPWVRYCYNVINTFSTGDDLPFCNTLWHIFCTLNTSQLKATMKLKNLLAVIQSNLLFCLYILHSSFLAPPVIDQLLGVSCAAESSMRQQWEDLRQWLCPGKGETFKYHFHFSKPIKLLDICFSKPPKDNFCLNKGFAQFHAKTFDIAKARRLALLVTPTCRRCTKVSAEQVIPGNCNPRFKLLMLRNLLLNLAPNLFTTIPPQTENILCHLIIHQ